MSMSTGMEFAYEVARRSENARRNTLDMILSSSLWWVTSMLVIVSLLASAVPAHADGVADEADIAFRLGAERYVAGDHRQALLLFLTSHRLAPNANVAFNVARA